MGKLDFNKDWKCYKTGYRDEMFDVTLPHDAMLLDAKSGSSPGGVNTGWIEAKDYTYEKTFFVPQEWEELCPILEFEGVYHRATIFVNGQKAKYQHNGYLGFFGSVFETWGGEHDKSGSNQPRPAQRQVVFGNRDLQTRVASSFGAGAHFT